jgi:hypothetical protein
MHYLSSFDLQIKNNIICKPSADEANQFGIKESLSLNLSARTLVRPVNSWQPHQLLTAKQVFREENGNRSKEKHQVQSQRL